MQGWALTTCISALPGDRYGTILDVTRPLFEAYAAKWEMEFRPITVTQEMAAPYEGGIPHAHGTHVLTASYPAHRALMDEYDGVVYLDNDAVIVDSSQDICWEVNRETPIGLVPALAIGCWPMMSTLESRAFMDAFLDLRHEVADPDIPGRPPCPRWAMQWGEEGVLKELMGYTCRYRWPDRINAVPERKTRWTHLLKLLDWRWNRPERLDILGPYLDDVVLAYPPRIVHPVSLPFDDRLRIVKSWAERSDLCT